MKDELEIVSKSIVEKILHLQLKGVVYAPIVNQKLRILVVFEWGSRVRRFPIDAVCVPQEEGILFTAEEEISLPDIFSCVMQEASKNKEMPTAAELCEMPVQVSFEYCDALGEWIGFEYSFILDAAAFVKKNRKETFAKRCYRKVAYVFFTLLLPFWVADGILAVKGYKKSPYLTEKMSGKKAIFYHAQGIVKKYTGYGYSIREIKTEYFAKTYQKACGKIENPNGVLFLSERAVDKGGNLDLIREGVKRERLPWNEFIDTRPISRLPFSEIRKAACLAAAAKVIVLEDFYPQIHALTLRRETKLLQLWHACGAFKMFGLSDIGKVSNLRQDTKNHRNYSNAFVSGTRMVPFYSEAFGIAPNQVLPFGVPRTDIFFDKSYKERVAVRLYEKYPFLKKKRVVLFAPTFRGSGKNTAFYPMENFPIVAFMEKMPADTVLIIKNHPFVSQKAVYDEKYKNRVIDLTGRENMNDILFITDLLITDYSSSIFEAALLAVPMLFYVFDLEEYVNGRDIYFDFASFAPGRQVETFDEMTVAAAEILRTEKMEKDEKRQKFCEYFLDALDGHSTERILAYISRLLNQ